MPINITMKMGFMYLGATANSCTEKVPYPSEGMFTTSFLWQTQRSADGSLVGQQTGRSSSTQTMTWSRMDCNTWWSLNQWIESQGMSFYCRYFNFNIGSWQTRQFYVQKITCKPDRPAAESSANHGQPLMLYNCQMTVVDMGVVGE